MPRWTQDFVLKDTDSLDGLSEEAQKCIKLRYEQGLKYDQIVEALQIPMGTVKSRINRATERILANRLKAEPPYVPSQQQLEAADD